MGVFGKKKRKDHSDMELYNAYLMHMGDNMRLARSEALSGVIRLGSALKAIQWGVRAYRVFHPLPPPESDEDLSLIGRMVERMVKPLPKDYSLGSIYRQFGGEFVRRYRKLEENLWRVRREENGELVNESIELMEELAKKIREMLGLV
jgi:hypothetical protein